MNTTGHGFRSSFKDWARHEGVHELLSTFVLAHIEGSRTVTGYLRDDLLEQRRPVMPAWCDYICPPAVRARMRRLGVTVAAKTVH